MDIHEVMQYLAKSDEPAAKASSEAKHLDRHLKVVKSQQYMLASGTIAEREAIALTSPEYEKAEALLSEAEANDLLYRNERSTNTMRFEFWRSNNANRRQGGGNL